MLKARSDPAEDETPFDHLDEQQLETAFAAMAGEMEGLEDAEDPRQLGHALRRFGQLSGLELGPRMEEALSRLEAGEDIESLEAELDTDADDDSLDDFFRLKKAIQRRRQQPKRDDELYFF